MEIETQETLKLLSLVPIDVQEKKFQTLMLIYEKAMIQAKEELEGFKANVVLDMPCENLIEQGTSNIEITDMSNIIFKRLK